MAGKLVHGLFLMAGVAIGIALQVFRDFFIPTTLDKVGDAASVVSALMATLTLIFGFFLAYQWRSQFLFSERYKSLSDLEERLRIFTDVWTEFNCQQFTEEQVFVGHDLLSEDVKQAFDAEYKSYAYVWKKAYRLGCVVKGACLDPDIILREIVDHTVCNNLSGSESNSYEMVLGRLKAFGLTTVNELETSFERLMK